MGCHAVFGLKCMIVQGMKGRDQKRAEGAHDWQESTMQPTPARSPTLKLVTGYRVFEDEGTLTIGRSPP